ncbi:MAG: hypothetical protein IKF36_00785 [Bacilli bacterium]|nr:hypothetical protein [Bacilli bacterium]
MFNKCCSNTCCPTICTENCPTDPIYEQPINNCVQKDFIHDVVHIVPIHTNVINNHIYKHSYVPEYTCSEENTVREVYDSCSGFMNN